MSDKAVVLERFIPVTIERLMDTLCQSNVLSEVQKKSFADFCIQYRKLYHAQTLPFYQTLTRDYIPFNPDVETIHNLDYSEIEKQTLQAELLEKISVLLNNANYEQLSLAKLKIALEELSPYGVKVSVDLDAFSEMLLFYRGRTIRYKQQRHWKSLFLKKKTHKVELYSRLFILLKLKSLNQQVQELASTKNMPINKAEKKLKSKLSDESVGDDKIYIKLFKDIPCSDLEMLFPNTKIKMRLFDKLKLGVTGGGGTVGGVFTIMSKLTVALDPIAMITAILGFLGLLWRQITKVFTQRTKYMAELAKNLYYYNLDNNLGALAHINNVAADSEAKETLLSYFFLLTQGEMTVAALDEKIETFIKTEYDLAIDFEVSDGLSKLKRLGLLIEKNDLVSVVSLNQTLIILEELWQQCFDKHS
ncbi:MAG: DUF3754 domain-containing protein [Methylococcales bacterium]|nr:DUF3754 domain-containing protein [Methylococcales bacterium]